MRMTRGTASQADDSGDSSAAGGLMDVECEPTSSGIFHSNWWACKKLLVLRPRLYQRQILRVVDIPAILPRKVSKKEKGLNETLMKGPSLRDKDACLPPPWRKMDLEMSSGQPRLYLPLQQTCAVNSRRRESHMGSNIALILRSVTGLQFTSIRLVLF